MIKDLVNRDVVGMKPVAANFEIFFHVTYSANGGTNPPADSTDYSYGDTVTVAVIGTMARVGYTFVEWNTQSDGLGTAYNPSATFSMPSGNVILYAQWVGV